MADVNKTIEISYTANIGALERALKRIPGITEDQMKKAINEVEKELKQFEKASKKSAKSFKQKFSGMAKGAQTAGAAIAGAGVALLAFGQRVADATNDLVDTSTKTGIAAETLQGLKIAAEGSGLAFEQFIGPLQKLQFFMVEANNQNKNAIELFDKMGVQINDTNGNLKDADTVFREMMSSLGDMESDLERNSLLMKMFGESGAIFAQSGAVGALDEFVSLGREFGVNVGPEAVKQAADFQRAMADLSTVGTGAMQDILMSITGTNGLTSAIDETTGFIISFKHIFIATFEALAQPIRGIIHQINAIHLALSGDFTGAGDEMQQSFIEAGDVISNFVHMIDNVEEELSALRRARNLIRNQNDDDSASQTRNHKRQSKENDEKIKQVKKLIEVRKDDLDVLQQMFFAQSKLKEMSVELFQGELDDIEVVKQNHQKRLDMIDEIVLAEQKSRMERSKELKQALDDGTISEEEYNQRRVGMLHEFQQTIENANEARFQSEKKLQRDIVEIDSQAIDEMAAKRMESIQNYFNEVTSLVGGISSAFMEIQDQTVNHFVQNRDAAIENIMKLEKAGTITAEESAKRREDIEKAYQTSIQNQMMKAFRMKQAASVAAILMDMAQASARAFADFPFPASVGIAALAAGKAGLELAAVQSQPPPKFDVGGMVGQSDPLAPDQTQAQLLSGEAVLDRSTVQRLGGEQGIRDLQNTPQSNVVVIQPFKHFDRFLSANEKRGRFGSKRASGRY
tara:strand:- start:12016 stop:14241 length:2226 start_codon:yes stop_codon:yes gene_type:complete